MYTLYHFRQLQLHYILIIITIYIFAHIFWNSFSRMRSRRRPSVIYTWLLYTSISFGVLDFVCTGGTPSRLYMKESRFLGQQTIMILNVLLLRHYNYSNEIFSTAPYHKAEQKHYPKHPPPTVSSAFKFNEHQSIKFNMAHHLLINKLVLNLPAFAQINWHGESLILHSRFPSQIVGWSSADFWSENDYLPSRHIVSKEYERFFPSVRRRLGVHPCSSRGWMSKYWHVS